ncbi:hypothetical protein ACQR2L_07500 [Clostridium butyricum]|uniref:hypothetical protein n=1 Tax=Clostridium butyricum TaxID=1492 RepID=UPI003D147F89
MKDEVILKELDNHLDSEGYVDFESFPTEKQCGKYLVIENEGTETEKLICSNDTEIEAYKIVKGFIKKNKSIYKGNIILTDLCGIKYISDYEKLDKIK